MKPLLTRENTRQTVLVIAAHADDEAMGCSGTLARHIAEGDDVHFLFLSDGVTSRKNEISDSAVEAETDERRKMCRKAVDSIGGCPPTFLNFPDNRMDGVELLTLIKPIEALIGSLQPNLVYTNHANDLNVDHRVTHMAVLTACRPLLGSSIKAIYSFETPSSTEWAPVGSGPYFNPTRFVDISNYLELKMATISAYQTEMRVFPHPRSYEAIEALWTWRGAQVGMKAAEAFVVVRECL